MTNGGNNTNKEIKKGGYNMASEFTRKIQKIKDILTFNSALADDGDVLLTKSGEVYTQVNGKVKQLSNPNYGAGNVNKILAVSDTGEVVPIVMPSAGDILGKDNTFTGNNTFNQPINASLKVRLATFTDLATVTQDMGLYSGLWRVDGTQIKNAPSDGSGWYNIEVQLGDWAKAGFIKLYDRAHEVFYYASVNNGNVLTWHKIADDINVVHNAGNETISGDKTLNGQTTLLNGNFGLRVTNSGIVKTTDAGATWVAL